MQQAQVLTQELFTKQVLKVIVSTRSPFRMVEDPEWIELCRLQNPLFLLPGATTIRRYLAAQSEQVNQSLLADVVPGSKLALSLDAWSSKTRNCFLGIMAHFIDKNWKLQSRLIGFEPLHEVHSGKELATVLHAVCQHFQLNGRVSAITTDNASNNSTLMSELNHMLQDALENHTFLDGQVIHVPCMSHILQLSLQALLGQIRIKPSNETFIREWKEREERRHLAEIQRENDIEGYGIPFLLAKGSYQTFLY